MEVADLIPGSRFIIYEDSGHVLAAEEPIRLVVDILNHSWNALRGLSEK